MTAGPIAANPTDIHNLTWNFNSGAQPFNFLAAGQSLSIAYTVRATDSSATPATGDQTVTITINGTDNAPVISVQAAAPADNASATLTETDTTLTGTGTLTVRDLDFSNTVTASVVSPAVLTGTTGGLTSADVIGMLTVTVGAIAADPTDIHNLTWTFNSGAQAFNFLAAGQSLSIAYTVRATDSSATPATGDQTVTITINGTNDAPVISVQAAAPADTQRH